MRIHSIWAYFKKINNKDFALKKPCQPKKKKEKKLGVCTMFSGQISLSISFKRQFKFNYSSLTFSNYIWDIISPRGLKWKQLMGHFETKF